MDELAAAVSGTFEALGQSNQLMAMANDGSHRAERDQSGDGPSSRSKHPLAGVTGSPRRSHKLHSPTAHGPSSPYAVHSPRKQQQYQPAAEPLAAQLEQQQTFRAQPGPSPLKQQQQQQQPSQRFNDMPQPSFHLDNPSTAATVAAAAAAATAAGWGPFEAAAAAVQSLLAGGMVNLGSDGDAGFGAIGANGAVDFKGLDLGQHHHGQQQDQRQQQRQYEARPAPQPPLLATRLPMRTPQQEHHDALMSIAQEHHHTLQLDPPGGASQSYEPPKPTRLSQHQQQQQEQQRYQQLEQQRYQQAQQQAQQRLQQQQQQQVQQQQVQRVQQQQAHQQQQVQQVQQQQQQQQHRRGRPRKNPLPSQAAGIGIGALAPAQQSQQRVGFVVQPQQPHLQQQQQQQPQLYDAGHMGFGGSGGEGEALKRPRGRPRKKPQDNGTDAAGRDQGRVKTEQPSGWEQDTLYQAADAAPIGRLRRNPQPSKVMRENQELMANRAIAQVLRGLDGVSSSRDDDSDDEEAGGQLGEGDAQLDREADARANKRIRTMLEVAQPGAEPPGAALPLVDIKRQPSTDSAGAVRQPPLPTAAAGQRLERTASAAAQDVARDMEVAKDRKKLAEQTRQELGVDTLAPETTNVATLVQRILKCGVLSGRVVEYRKRTRNGTTDHNKGIITPSGLIRCRCHSMDVTMSEFEQHSGSCIHRPAEYIYLKSIDMSLKNFALLVLSQPIDCNLWYCLLCREGGSLLCCDNCPAAFHPQCMGTPAPPEDGRQWFCTECTDAGHKPALKPPGAHPSVRFPAALVVADFDGGRGSPHFGAVPHMRRALAHTALGARLGVRNSLAQQGSGSLGVQGPAAPGARGRGSVLMMSRSGSGSLGGVTGGVGGRGGRGRGRGSRGGRARGRLPPPATRVVGEDGDEDVLFEEQQGQQEGEQGEEQQLLLLDAAAMGEDGPLEGTGGFAGEERMGSGDMPGGSGVGVSAGADGGVASDGHGGTAPPHTTPRTAAAGQLQQVTSGVTLAAAAPMPPSEAVQHALQTATALVATVMAADSLVDVKRHMAAAGAELLHVLGTLL